MFSSQLSPGLTIQHLFDPKEGKKALYSWCWFNPNPDCNDSITMLGLRRLFWSFFIRFFHIFEYSEQPKYCSLSCFITREFTMLSIRNYGGCYYRARLIDTLTGRVLQEHIRYESYEFIILITEICRKEFIPKGCIKKDKR